MKTKPITLILTLLFCLSGSVFAEDVNSANPEYNPLKTLLTLGYKAYKARNDVNDVKMRIIKSNNGILTSETNDINKVMRLMEELESSIKSMRNVMFYESVIVQRKISDNMLRKKHNEIKGNEVIFLKRAFDRAEQWIKEYQININNTTAVISINEYLKVINELKIWHKNNRNKKLNISQLP